MSVHVPVDLRAQVTQVLPEERKVRQGDRTDGRNVVEAVAVETTHETALSVARAKEAEIRQVDKAVSGDSQTADIGANGTRDIERMNGDVETQIGHTVSFLDSQTLSDHRKAGNATAAPDRAADRRLAYEVGTRVGVRRKGTQEEAVQRITVDQPEVSVGHAGNRHPQSILGKDRNDDALETHGLKVTERADGKRSSRRRDKGGRLARIKDAGSSYTRKTQEAGDDHY